MTIFLDKRSGSINLETDLKSHNVDVVQCLHDSDIEFLGYGPNEELMTIGVEYKLINDCVDAMTTGRLTGTQLARMVKTYQRWYLLIEGRLRTAADGVLEHSPAGLPGKWFPVQGRKGRGWTAKEFWGRVASLEEFWGCRVHVSQTIEESAAWLVDTLYRYWTRPYSSHSSWAQWDQSRLNGPKLNVEAMLGPTSELPLVQKWARDIDGIGVGKAGYVAQHFKSGLALAIATEDEWAKVSWVEKLRTKSGYRRKKFSKKTIKGFMQQIGHVEEKSMVPEVPEIYEPDILTEGEDSE